MTYVAFLQLLKSAQELNASEGYIFKNLEKDGK